VSFRLKTVLGIASIEIVMLAILVWSGINYVTKSSEAGLINAAKVSAKLLATMTTDALIGSDLARLQSLVKTGLSNEGMVYIRIRSAAGKTLVEEGDRSALSESFKDDRSVADAVDHDRFDISHPIVVGGLAFGSVELGISTLSLRHNIAEARNWLVSVAALEIALVAVFGIVLGTILTRQLLRLSDGALAISRGSLGHQIAVSGNDELAQASRCFNAMSGALFDYASELRAAREKAELARDYAETTLKDAIDCMPNGVAIVSADDAVEFVNLSYSGPRGGVSDAGSLGGEHAADLSELCREKLALIENTEGQSLDERVRERMQHFRSKSGRAVVEDRTTDGRDLLTQHQSTSSGGLVIVETDVTEIRAANERNRRLELELMQRQKMESLGTMAGGIAHEINTPLQYIRDNVDFLRHSFSDILRSRSYCIPDSAEAEFQPEGSEPDWEFLSSEIPAAIDEAEHGLDAVTAIVKSIKQYAHGEDDQHRTVDISEVVQNAVTLSRNEWKYRADLSLDSDEHGLSVSCAANEISQVVINLIVNAAQAIEEHGLSAGQGKIVIGARRDGNWVDIRVSDNGPGVPDCIKDRIFDLFFTTKAPGVGTGQGLAISKVIIEQKHKGQLLIEASELGGATFVVRLPASAPNQSDL
jgi:two-component system NtrC family sensor kinase